MNSLTIKTDIWLIVQKTKKKKTNELRPKIYEVIQILLLSLKHINILKLFPILFLKLQEKKRNLQK